MRHSSRVGAEPTLFRYAAATMLTPEQLGFFETHGYLAVEGLLGRDVLEPVIVEYEGIMAELRAGWIADGALDPAAPTGSFEDQIIAAYRAGLEYFQPMDISLPPGDITPDLPFHAGPAIFALMTNDRLLDAVEQFIGPEITSNPIQHVRIKPPSADLSVTEERAHITFTDWHQDRAVALPEADRTRMVTTWVAITDATVENGCLRVIPGSHRGSMLPHCPKPQAAIADGYVDEAGARPVPVKAGGVIFFHPLTIHGSLANTSPGVRWSFDLRYNATEDPTGRPFFPGFVARSRAHPETELRDPAAWRAMWEAARARLAGGPPIKIHRWSADAEHCA